MCDSCHACDDRCECSYCEGCGIRGDFSTCHDCSRCDECCDCGSRGDYPLEFNTHSLRFIHADTFLVNPLTRPISLEIETQGANAPTYALERAIDHWDTSVVADGSLGDSGWELNTQPANGDAFVSLIQDHAKGLDAAECVVDESCGVHVHVDARDITEKELRKIIVLYQRVEPMLYALSGNRVSNRYCAPCGNYYGYWPHDPFEARMRLRSILYRDGKRLKKSQYYRDSSTKRTYLPEMGEKYHHSRYHALNIHSYYKRRTIEFRHHKGTVDGTRLQNWGLVCGHLIEFAKTHFYEEIMDIEGDALAVLLAITPASLHEWVTSRAKWLRNDFPVYNHAAAKAKAMAQKAEEQSEVIYKRQREAMLAETRRAESQSIYNNEAWGSN
jgi:hypothetical protein